MLLVSHKYSGSVALRLNPIVHRVRSKAVVIDGRKEWCCRFCLETKNVCQRCETDSPSGLQGKHL